MPFLPANSNQANFHFRLNQYTARSQARSQKRGHGRTDGSSHRAKKKSWGSLNKCWVPHDTRDQVVDFVRSWSDKTDIPVTRFVPWISITRSKYQDWVKRFGKVNEHNAWIPRDHWLTEDETMRICNFARQNPLEGYRRMTFMMLDANVVACSPSSVYRVLKKKSAGETGSFFTAGETGNRRNGVIFEWHFQSTTLWAISQKKHEVHVTNNEDY